MNNKNLFFTIIVILILLVVVVNADELLNYNWIPINTCSSINKLIRRSKSIVNGVLTRPEKIEVISYGNPDYKLPKFTIGILGSSHGNEPVGTFTLNELINNGYFTKTVNKYPNLQFIIVPNPNPHGVKNNTRYQKSLFKPDINRNYGSEEGDEPTSQSILRAFKKANLILDFHEGWGWHKTNKNSVGSGILPSGTPLSNKLSEMLLTELNNTIDDPNKKFMIIANTECDIESTLRCYMYKRKRDYILIEITGQNDIQPIELRKNQAKLIINTVVDSLGDSK